MVTPPPMLPTTFLQYPRDTLVVIRPQSLVKVGTARTLSKHLSKHLSTNLPGMKRDGLLLHVLIDQLDQL